MADVVAKVYADALFAAAVEENMLETVASDFQAFMGFFQEAKHLLLSPTIKQADKKALLETMTGEGAFANFVWLLFEKDRLSIIEDAKRIFDEKVDEKNLIVKAYVSSAVALSDAQRAEIKQKLDASTGFQTVIIDSVNPALIGGLVIRIGDKVLDGSVKSKLDSLLERMREIK